MLRRPTWKAMKAGVPVPDKAPSALDLLPTAKDLLKRGMWPQAEVLYRHIVIKDPLQGEVFNDLGIVRACQGDLAEAEKLARRAVALDEESAIFRVNLAKHLFGQNRADDAETEVYAALAIDWRHAAAIEALDLMQAQRRQAMADAAEPPERKKVAAPYRGKLRKPAKPERQDPEQLLSEAYKLFSEHNYDAVIHTLRTLEADHPGHPLAALWTALCHFRQDDLKRARRWADKAVEIAPDDHATHMAQGLVLQAELAFDEAEAAFRAGMALAPKNADFHSALAFQKLLNGDWPEGWRLFDKVNQALTKLRLGPVDPWKGERLDAETLHIWALEGVGDFLMMARLLPELENRAGKLVVECDERLMPLLERSVTSAELIGLRTPGDGAPLSPLGDFQSTDRGVIRHLSPDLHPVDMETADLVPDQERVDEIRDRYKERFSGQMLVGLSWYTTSPAQGQARSIEPAELAPLIAQSNCQFIDLQYRDPDRDMEAYEFAPGQLFRDEEIDARDDFDALAAQLAALDLVISIDNSTAQLAGALGVPAWVLLHQLPDWRWGLRGDASAWYPSVRLFRQSTQGDWSGVMDQVCSELDALSGDTRMKVSA